jgi:mRNA interferase MazF
MGTLSARSVVFVRFPFSDLTASKLRPAVVLANTSREDIILCQITSNPYADVDAICLADVDFEFGSLQHISFARPGKLFTANASLVVDNIGKLTITTQRRIINQINVLLQRENGSES